MVYDELAVARRVAEVVAESYGVPVSDVFAADHTHEGLAEGASSVALEGVSDDWAYTWPNRPEADDVAEELGVWFEPVNHCILAIYPEMLERS